jgi:hypothetical protein
VEESKAAIIRTRLVLIRQNEPHTQGRLPLFVVAVDRLRGFSIPARFGGICARFGGTCARFGGTCARFGGTCARFGGTCARFGGTCARFGGDGDRCPSQETSQE